MEIKLIYGLGYQVFMEKGSYEFKVSYEEGWEDLINVFFKTLSTGKKDRYFRTIGIYANVYDMLRK